ncbi:MAG: ABC transporter substrate-binding protein [Desulfobacula sp.]|nr:ABC transporter substrate-binding protein [Desulfobacula sp.]
MKKILFAVIILSIFSFFTVHASQPIKIAAIFAKSGLASITNDEFDIINLAAKTINKNGGVLGRQIEIVEFDNKSTAIGSKKAAIQAVKQNVTAVIGATWSSHSLVMAPILQKAKIPMISPAATNPKVTLIGDYIFRACFTDPFQGKIMATFAVKDLKAKTTAILINASNDYSLDLAQCFKKTATEIGLKISLEEKYMGREVNFSTILNKVKAVQPDVIFVPGNNMDSALIIKQARKIGITAIFLGGDAWSDLMFDFADSSILEGGYHSGHWHPEVSLSKNRQLPDDLLKKYHGKMDTYIPLFYDAVLLIVEAIEHTNSLDLTKIRDKLTAIKNFEVITGTITFDKNGDPLNKDAVIVKFTQEKTKFVKSIKP